MLKSHWLKQDAGMLSFSGLLPKLFTSLYNDGAPEEQTEVKKKADQKSRFKKG